MKEFKVGERVLFTCVESAICGNKGPYHVMYPAIILRINKKTIRIEITNCFPHRPPWGFTPPARLALSVRPDEINHIDMVEVKIREREKQGYKKVVKCGTFISHQGNIK